MHNFENWNLHKHAQICQVCAQICSTQYVWNMHKYAFLKYAIYVHYKHIDANIACMSHWENKEYATKNMHKDANNMHNLEI